MSVWIRYIGDYYIVIVVLVYLFIFIDIIIVFIGHFSYLIGFYTLLSVFYNRFLFTSCIRVLINPAGGGE